MRVYGCKWELEGVLVNYCFFREEGVTSNSRTTEKMNPLWAKAFILKHFIDWVKQINLIVKNRPNGRST